MCVRTSGSQSRAVVVYREVTLALGDPPFADYHKACVSGERRKEADGSTCLHFWLCLFRPVLLLLITELNMHAIPISFSQCSYRLCT